MWTQMAYLPWVQVPANGLVEVLKGMSWRRQGQASAARDVAALMIYVVLLFIRKDRTVNRVVLGIETNWTEYAADITYDGLVQATGLSRSLIRQGLERLELLGLIRSSGSRQTRQYVFPQQPGRWFKLPCRAVMTRDGVAAFKTFSLRSKHELNAMKLYLYLADVRDRDKNHTEVSYEMIFKRLDIPERDIRRAINVLNASGLLARVNRESDRLVSSWGPNQYFLKGYEDLQRATQ